MNKLIVAGALALGLVLTAQQEASAWTKWSVNVGVSIHYEGGNNNFLWGMFRSGQVPGYPTDVCMDGPFGGVAAAPYIDPGYAYGYAAYPAHDSAAPVTTEPPVAPPPAKTGTQAIYYPNQPAAYYPNAGSYQYPAYGYSYGSGYGYAQQVPSYWYGR